MNLNFKKKKLELLAPAGSYQGILAAFSAGADAVYTGGSLFSARAYADNCSSEELVKAIRLAHLLDRKLYLTVNTLLKDAELLGQLKEYLKPLVDAGLDAVIVQDFGVLRFLKREFPDLDLHASTQMTVAGPYGASFIAPYITRLVTPRELNLSEIKRIYDATHLEIECFVHGALCYCYSGRCLMSSVYGGRSGNRGRCAQPCRLNYTLEDASGNVINRKNENLLISPKDLCGIDRIPEMADAGVYSFKIEGRMKKPEYTAGVVSIYRKYMDLYEEWSALGCREELSSFRASKEDRDRLMLLFSRNGFTDGYFDRQNGRDMLMLTPKEDRGDNQNLLGELKKKYVDAGALKRRISMDPVHVTLGEPITIRLCAPPINSSGALSENDDRFPKEACSITITSESVVSQASKRPMTREDFAEKLSRFGNSPFELSAPVSVNLLSENVFFPVSELNALRQKAISLLEEKLTDPNLIKNHSFDFGTEKSGTDVSIPGRSGQEQKTEQIRERNPEQKTEQAEDPKQNQEPKQKVTVSVLVRTEEQLYAVLQSENNFGKMRIIFSSEDQVFLSQTDDYGHLKKLCEECHANGHEVFLELPEIFRRRAELYFDAQKELLEEGLFDGYLLHSVDEINYLIDSNSILMGDSSLYVMNREAVGFLRDAGLSSWTLSEELTGREMIALLRNLGADRGSFELPIYGRRPVMISAQCLTNTVRGCARKDPRRQEDLMLVDRRGEHLPVRKNCSFCYNTIYNARTFSLLQEDLSEFAALGATFRISFFEETASEVKDILSKVSRKTDLGWKKIPGLTELGERYTREHYRDGVL